MEESRSRCWSRTRSPPLRREEHYRDRSLGRKRSRSSNRNYIQSPSSRSARSPIRGKHSRSPRRRNSFSPERRRPSRSPEGIESRSYSHRHDQNRPLRSGGGFKWKQRGQDDDRYERKGYKRLDRGYRGEQAHKRPRSPFRDEGKVPKCEALPTERPKEKKEERAMLAPVGEPMIIVNINDRLGTKASIPCLASDPISNTLGFLLHSLESG